MTKAQEFRDQTVEELEALYNDYSKELFQMRNKTREELKKPDQIFKKRKDIARILTIINEKKKDKK